MKQEFLVCGHEVRLVPARSGEDERFPSEAGEQVVTRLMNLVEGRTAVHSMLASRVFQDGVLAELRQAERDFPVGTYYVTDDAREKPLWVTASRDDHESGVDGVIVGWSIYNVLKERYLRGRKWVLRPPQIIPYVSVRIVDQYDVEKMVHVRLLEPGDETGFVRPEDVGHVREIVKDSYVHLKKEFPFGHLVRVAIDPRGHYELVKAVAEDEAAAPLRVAS